jgi:ribosomal protein S18 acetylase RimI-like enzyme
MPIYHHCIALTGAYQIHREQRMHIAIRHTQDGIDWEELAALYRAAPLGDKSADDLRLVYGNSMYKCFVFDEGKLVGAGRCLADGMDVAYIGDVALLPQYQGKGLGKLIIQSLLELSTGHKKRILYAVPGKEDFYRSMGFLRMGTAMAIFPDRERAVSSGLLKED